MEKQCSALYVIFRHYLLFVSIWNAFVTVFFYQFSYSPPFFDLEALRDGSFLSVS